MTASTPIRAGRPARRLLPLLGLWTAAAAMMLALHGGAIWAARDWHPIGPPPNEPLPPIEIDMPPPPEPAPPQPPQEPLPEVKPDPLPDTPTDTVQPVQPDAAPTETMQAEEVRPVTPPQQPEEVQPQEVKPDTPEETKAETPPNPVPAVVPETPPVQQAEVVMPPAPKPARKERKPPAPQKQPVRQPVEQPRAQPPRPQPSPGPTPQQAQERRVAIQSWANSVRSRVARVTAQRGGTTRGTATVVLRVSGSGQVVSIAVSGANPEATAKAKSLLQGLGSVPAPPDGKAQSVPPITILFK
jgi:periplasmic protein TonB